MTTHRATTSRTGRPGAKLTWKRVAEIRQRFDVGEKTMELAQRYSVTPETIRNIVSNRTWRENAK